MIPLNQNLTTLKRSAIRVYSNLARETPDCAMLTIGEPDFDTPEAIKAAACAALHAGNVLSPLRRLVGSLEHLRIKIEAVALLACEPSV